MSGDNYLTIAEALCRELDGQLLVRELRPGDFVHLEGDSATSLSIVAGGQLVVHAYPPGSFEPAAVGVLGPGSLIGEEALASGALRHSTVTALTTCHLFVAFREDLIEHMTAHPTVRRLFFRLQGELHRARLREGLANSAAKVDLRIARWLHHCAEVTAGVRQGAVVVHLRQELLASLAATRRPTANRVLQEFETQGLIRLRRGAVEVTSRPDLLEWITLNTKDTS